jgi:LmbE family N-acetylglucosaminyl deacetylase
MTSQTAEALITGENLMILAPNPGDETQFCGRLIAQCCRRGRPPFVMVLADGSAGQPDAFAARRERDTRAALGSLGLPAERMLMAGLFQGTIPESGATFEAVVRAVTLVMWARDCNVVCAPPRDAPDADHRATAAIAATVVSRSGVALLSYGSKDDLLF